jgi:hypothetical protein
VTGLTVENVSLSVKVEDERPAVVLDDVEGATFQNFQAQVKSGVPVFVKVTNTRKREPVQEYVKDLPYKTTSVTNLTFPAGMASQDVVVDRPAPGTPPDTLYALPTAPSAANPYAFTVPNASYPLPLTVHRPFFSVIGDKQVSEAETLEFTVAAKSIAPGVPLAYSAEGLPAGATFDPATRGFAWTPDYRQSGTYTVRFVVNDGVIPESADVVVNVADVPSSQLIDELIGDLGGLGLPQDIESGLTDKLNSARKSWEKGNNDAAINQMGAFINQTRAQSGKAITPEEAAGLISRANSIIYSMG